MVMLVEPLKYVNSAHLLVLVSACFAVAVAASAAYAEDDQLCTPSLPMIW